MPRPRSASGPSLPLVVEIDHAIVHSTDGAGRYPGPVAGRVIVHPHNIKDSSDVDVDFPLQP